MATSTPAAKRLRGKLTFSKAAELLLAQADRPLTTKEIVERALSLGLLSTKGKTPEATMAAKLYHESGKLSSGIVRLFTPGAERAVRGSVRWTIAGRRQAG